MGKRHSSLAIVILALVVGWTSDARATQFCAPFIASFVKGGDVIQIFFDQDSAPEAFAMTRRLKSQGWGLPDRAQCYLAPLKSRIVIDLDPVQVLWEVSYFKAE